MKNILVGLLVIILAVQEIKAGLGWLKPGHVIPTNTNEVVPNLNTTNKVVGIEQLMEEKFDKLDQKVEQKLDAKFEKLNQKMKEKFADLHKALATRRTRELTNFEKIGSKYYFFEHTEKVNWFVAAHICEEMDANLAGLQSVEEFDAVSRKLTNKNYWLNINDLGNAGVFKLQNSGQNVDNLNLPWHEGEPSNGNDDEHCVELKYIHSKYAMNDRQCLAKLNFICEKNKLE